MATRALGAGTVLLTAALASVALGLSTQPASAAATEIDFTGGSVAGLFCRSTPSTNQITVPAGTKLRFNNHLGQDATLRVNGTTFAVPANEARPVWVASSTTASMTFPCTLSEDFESVTITVTSAGAPTPPRPVPGGGANVPPVQVPTTAPVPQTTGPTPPRGGSATKAPTPAPEPGTGTAAANGAPRGGGARVTTAQPPAARPTTKAPSPRAGTVAGGTVVPGGSTSGDQSALANQVGGGAPPEAAVGALEPAAGTPVSGPAGLLALLAAVCVVGVAYAALRTIIAKRTGGRFA